MSWWKSDINKNISIQFTTHRKYRAYFIINTFCYNNASKKFTSIAKTHLNIHFHIFQTTHWMRHSYGKLKTLFIIIGYHYCRWSLKLMILMISYNAHKLTTPLIFFPIFIHFHHRWMKKNNMMLYRPYMEDTIIRNMMM